jgi:integrase
MPHFAKPFFKASRNTWYVQIGTKQHNLGPDRQQAFERYHELMRHQPREADCSLAVGVLDAFLSWAKNNKKPRTYEWYQRHIQVFARSVPVLLSTGQLKKHHLTACVESLKDWSPSSKNGLCRAVCRAFSWAEQEELIPRSPLARFKKPKAKRREVVITDEEFAFMLASFKIQNIHDLLTTAWETGARPQEITAVERRHVDLQLGRWVFPPEESKGGERPRIVYLNAAALEITTRLCLKHPDGPIFRNEDGERWNRHSLNCVFGRLQVTLGMRRMKELGITVEPLKRFKKADYPDAEALAAARSAKKSDLHERRKEIYKLARKHGRKFTLYHLRHSFCTRALKRGVDPLTVANLLGHADPSMLAKVYSHLTQDPEYMRRSINRATGA